MDRVVPFPGKYRESTLDFLRIRVTVTPISPKRTDMNKSDYAIGQAVYIRTDSPDYEEETFPFKSLGELVRICTEPKDDLVLEKVIVYAMPEGEPHAVTFNFVAATRGEKPGNLEEMLK